MTTIKLRAGKYMIPVQMWKESSRFFFKFGYNQTLMAEIKAMQGRKYHGYDEINPRKLWSIPDTPRNRFQLSYLMGENPYDHYDKPLLTIDKFDRSVFEHQKEITAFELTRRCCIVAAEMATGKTLATIECIERSGITNWWWVGPKWALRAVQNEFKKWKAKVQPIYFTYEALLKVTKQGNFILPEGIVFDEAAKIKNPQAQRSQAARHIADLMREKFPYPFIILLSGAPAPKSPIDWWHLCEIACPGFLKEGDINKFKERLAIISKEESISGATFQKIVAWRDDSNRCTECGLMKEDHDLDVSHGFQPGVNEVYKLYERMKGLVIVKRKKECLDLPDKIFRIIRCQPTQETLRAYSLIKNTSKTAIEALTRARELSDGFQYAEVESGPGVCTLCNGTGTISGQLVGTDESVQCTNCNGTGACKTYVRQAQQFPCPKDGELIQLLEEHEDIGRLVVFAGFTGAIDKISELCVKSRWDVTQLDGRGLRYFGENISSRDPLDLFLDIEHDRNVCFVSHPGSGGAGLNLQVSPTCVFYSNDFNADYRIQAMERIHRPGMDYNRGATIVDLFHLPTDEYVHDNLSTKINLQALTLGDLQQWSQRVSNDRNV